MPDLDLYGLTETDIGEEQLESASLGLDRYGLTEADLGIQQQLLPTNDPTIFGTSEGRFFRREPVGNEIPILPGQEPSIQDPNVFHLVASTTKSALGQLEDMVASFNRGMIGLLDLPLMMLGAGSDLVGGPEVPSLFDSKFIQQGTTPRNLGPEGFLFEALEQASEFAGAGFSAKGAAQGFIRAPAALTPVGTTQGILRDVVATPLSLELKAASGGGLASTAVAHNEVLSDSAAANLLAPIVGGIAFSVPGPLINRTRQALKQKQTRAGEVLVAAADDPDLAVRNLAEKAITDIGGAAQTNDVGIMTLARSLAKESSVFEGQLDDQFVVTQRLIKEELENLFTPDGRPISSTAAQDFLKRHSDDLLTQLDERMLASLDKVKEIALLKRGKINDLDVSRRAKVELEKALGDIKNQEKVLWANVDKQVPIATDLVKREALAIVEDATKATVLPEKTLSSIIGSRIEKGRDGFFVSNKPVAGGWEKTETAGTFMELRSNLLIELRNESKDAIASKQAPMLSRLQGAAVDAIDQNTLVGLDESAYRLAANFTRRIHETFDQGLVGRILTSNTKGGEAIVSEKTLSTLLASGRETQAAGTRELIAANQLGVEVGKDSSFLKSAQEYMAAKFQREVKTSEDAATYLLDNEAFLKRFPAFRKVIGQALDDIGLEQGKIDLATASKASIEKSIFSKIAGMNGRKAITRILAERNPTQTAQQLKTLLKSNPEALKGMQRDILDNFLDATFTATRITAKSDKAFGKNALDKTFDRLAPLLKTFYSKENIQSFQLLKREAINAENLARSRSGNVDLPRGLITDLLARVTGAKLASSLVGSSGSQLIAATAGSKVGRHIVFSIPENATKAVLMEAVLDKRLMSMLLSKGLKTEAHNKTLSDALRIVIRQQVGPAAADEFDANLKVVNGDR